MGGRLASFSRRGRLSGAKRFQNLTVSRCQCNNAGADQLTHYLAAELNVPRTEVCDAIGLYFKQPTVRHLQPNNLLGNAFRSLVVEILRDYGSPGISYSEEVDPSL